MLNVRVIVVAWSLSHVQLLATPWTAGSSIHGIFQARVLEWGAIAFSDTFISYYFKMEIYMYLSVIHLPISILRTIYSVLRMYGHMLCLLGDIS